MTHPLLLAVARHQRNRLTRNELVAGTVTAPRELVLDFARWAERFTLPPGRPMDWYEQPFELLGLTITIADRQRPGSFL